MRISDWSSACALPITARQRDRVDGFVARAAADTPAEIVTGGTRPDRPGFYYSPTLIARARHLDEIVQKEVFGPVVSVTRFVDDAQVLGRAKEWKYGPAPRQEESREGKKWFIT